MMVQNRVFPLKQLLLLGFVLLMLSCKSRIAPLYRVDPDLPEGTYYKDLNNDLDKFVGTWLWQNDSISFKMVLQKKEQVLNSHNKYFDMIIGEYQYIENGTEIINSLDRLNDSSIQGFGFYIAGRTIMHRNRPPLKCFDCTPDERRLRVYFDDPGTPHIPMQMVLRHVVDNGVETLQAMIKGAGSYFDSEVHPNSPRVYFGEYFTLIKQ